MAFDISLLSDPEAEGPRRESEWNRLFQTMMPRLQSFFARRVENEDELDDLLAGIWQRAALRISTLEAAEALWSWLVTIGVNLLRDRGRAHARQGQRLGHPVALEAMDADRAVAERLAGDFLSTDFVRDASQLLRGWVTGDDWELLQLWAVDELTHSEIATRLRLTSPEASRQRVSRLCARLRMELAAAVKEVA
jgi:DNA-directed RNA polymerase specialized sigma24 family protein